MANFQLSMLSPNLHDSQLPTFDAESKSAKIPKSGGGGGGGAGSSWLTSNFRW